MGLTNENVEPKILAKIKIYVLTRAELLFMVCYEIPCSKQIEIPHFLTVLFSLPYSKLPCSIAFLLSIVNKFAFWIEY